MSISEFTNNLKCKHCNKEGFQGRKAVDIDYAVDTHISEKEMWTWDCKYCGKENKLYFRRNDL